MSMARKAQDWSSPKLMNMKGICRIFSNICRNDGQLCHNGHKASKTSHFSVLAALMLVTPMGTSTATTSLATLRS